MSRLLPIHYAARNLGRSRLRLALIVAGSALLVLTTLVAAAFVRGMDQSLRSSGGEHNVILLGAGSEESIERSEVSSATAGIVAASIRGIRERAGVVYVSPEVHVQLPVTVSATDGADAETSGGPMVLVRGVTYAALLVHDQVRIVEGRFPEPGRDEIMVGSAVGTRIGVADEALALGEELFIDARPWRIVGRFAATGTVMDAEIWTQGSDLREATKRDSDSCVILTLDPAQAEFADIAMFASIRLDLELAAVPETAYYARLSSFFAPIRFVVWVTAALIGLGGFLGGLNTTYAAFASRVREFGTLQSIGFRRAAVALSLVQESTIATAAGALLACAIGLFLLDGVAVRFSMGAFGLVVDETTIAVALGVGLALGLFGALPPAYRCLRLPVSTALKAM
jgi:putative ABC transport system permease protein